MSAPQPPADEDPAAPGDFGRRDAPATGADGTYEFHGEKLDFDPYRFGAPEPVAPAWSPPTAPAGEPGRPPTPGERWSPGADEPNADVRPGDYWQGGGSAPRQDAVFPPAGYSPPPGGGVDLGKQAPPGYPPPGGYPHAPHSAPRGGNGLAVAGMVVGIVGILFAFATWPGIIVGLVGLGLSIPGLVRARRGAPLKRMAIAGIATSVVAILLGAILLAVVLSRVDFDCVRDAGGNFEQAQECVK